MEIATKDTAKLQNRNRDSAPVNKFQVTPIPIHNDRKKQSIVVVEDRIMNRKNVITERRNVETVVENRTSHVQVNLHLRRLTIPQEKK